MKPTPLVTAAALLAFGLWRWRRRRLPGWWGIVGAIAIAALVVYGAGLVHPPSLEHVLRKTGSTLGAWTYLLVGAFAFLETGAFIGLIAPGETAVLLGGFVAGQGKINVVVLIAIVWAAAVAGDLTSFALGRRLGRDFLLRHGPKVKITEDRLERVEAFFARHGGPAILLGRFVGLVRALLPFVVGASGLELRRFLIFDVVGAGLWGGSLVLLGYVFWQSFNTLTKVAKQGFLALGVVIVVGAAGVWAVRRLRDPEDRARIVAYMEPRPALRPFLRVAQALARHVQQPYAVESAGAVAVLLAGAVGYGVAAHAAGHGGPVALDRDAFDLVRNLRSSAGVHVAKVVTALGATPFVVVVLLAGIAWLVGRRHHVAAAGLAIAALANQLALHVAKAAVGRPRPPDSLVSTQGSSFPSGHAAASIAYLALAVALWRVAPRGLPRAALLTCGLAIPLLVGLSRVYLHAHYLTDVLGGWGLGLAVYGGVGVAALTVERVRHNERER
ncbi:MAG: phosphatase family protein [Solirubrobacterales bacterium]|nr:phosphatase family protein [Solirubrobacterales bacterium]